MTVVEDAVTLLDQPHHDGSELYVLERPASLGDEVVVRLVSPRAVDTVGVRYVEDGEPRWVEAERDSNDSWIVRFPVRNPLVRYRWGLLGGDIGYAWLNGFGLVQHDVPDADDFVVSIDPGGPPWHLESVVYEIFPDRFASSGLDADVPDWALPRDWEQPVDGHPPNNQLEFYGGDLRGVEQHLDHVERLGANVVYLTPIFPARSTHRYDATSFDRVDPLLGGDEALESLSKAAHARGMRVVADLTTNHTGIGHEWFVRGEREVYLWETDDDYVSWLGVKTLPKLNWESPELRARMDGIVRRWLAPPYDLDGWRIDVANMSGRFADVDVNGDVAALIRDAVGDKLLVAEHNHDFRPDFAGWHGTMNYPGFARPAAQWLRGTAEAATWGGPIPRLGGEAVVATMRAFRAGIPWQSTLHSWLLLDSHDWPRFRTIAGSRDRQLVGVGLQMTTPGVPMIFAGDELGLEGAWGEDARRTMPWDRPETWDTQLLEEYRRLIALRRSHDALARGGVRYAYVDDDVIVYLRETREETLVCLASRAPHAPVRLPFPSLETLYGADAEDGVLPADGPSFHVWRVP